VASKASKTTFAKLDRERRLREKRQEKAARRLARKENAGQPEPLEPDPTLDVEVDEPGDDVTPESAHA
jgi:hypothetical protein